MIRVGIIGSGFGQYGLMPAFRSVRKCHVVALCAKKRPQVVEYCKRIGFTNIYSDWRKMLDEERLDAVALAVTPASQYKIAKVAINNGLHVFVEKPLAVNIRQAKELLDLARKKKIVHGIDFIFPEISEWKKVRKLLNSKKCGKLQYVSVHWDFLSYDLKNKVSTWKTNVNQGGGVTSFFFSHGFYYLEYFVGKITRMKGLFSKSNDSRNGGEAGIDLLLTFQNGITGHAHVYANSRGFNHHQLLLYCERGVIQLENKIGVVDNFSIKIYNSQTEHNIKVNKDKGNKDEDERVKIVSKLVKRFISCCQSGEQMYPSFEEGYRVQELIKMAQTAAALRK